MSYNWCIALVKLIFTILIVLAAIIQWSLRIKDMLRQEGLSFIERCPLFKCEELRQVIAFSFVERCLLLGVS